jgi:hypothetical protein
MAILLHYMTSNLRSFVVSTGKTTVMVSETLSVYALRYKHSFAACGECSVKTKKPHADIDPPGGGTICPAFIIHIVH